MNKKPSKDDKLKPLLPTLRIKKRFVRVVITSNKKFSFKDYSENLNKELLRYIGIIDYGIYGIWILKERFDEEKQEAIIKTSTKGLPKLLATLSLITTFHNTPVEITVKRVSGTLKGVYKENPSSSS